MVILINNKVIVNNMSNNVNIRDISNKLYRKLSSDNITTYLINNSLNEKDMIDKIKNNINNNTLIINNDMSNNNIEIIYSINKNDKLVSLLNNNLLDNKYVVDKYYQRRDSINTNKDYDKVISEFPNNESIIIKYNKINNIDKLVDILFYSIKSYLGLNNNYYIVKNGDTLYSIARRYNISVDKLKQLNNLNNNIINIGQKLSIPNSNNIEYIVNKGDTLYSISNKYNVSIKDIMNLNNLKNTNIYINQKLIIPKI